MARFTKLAALGLALLLAACCTALAATPNLLQYQGRLTDGAGSPLNGAFNTNFTIYSDSTGTTSLWTEMRPVTYANGFLSITLGTVSPINASVFNGVDRFLGIKVAPDATDMLPRQRIASVGFAMRAGMADSLSVLITTAGIADSAITLAKIATGAVGTAQVADGAITSAKIAAGAVGVADGSITSAKLATGAVGTAQVADGAITSAKIAAGAVGVADGSITSAKLAAGAVGTAQVADGAITSAKIAAGAVGAAQVAAGSLTHAKLSDGPGISSSVANRAGSIAANASAVIDSVDITIPAAGYIFLQTSGTWYMPHVTMTSNYCEWSINESRFVINSSAGYLFSAAPTGAPSTSWYSGAIALTMVVAKASADTYRFYLNAGTIGEGYNWEYVTTTAMYFPALYGSVSAPSLAPASGVRPVGDATGQR